SGTEFEASLGGAAIATARADAAGIAHLDLLLEAGSDEDFELNAATPDGAAGARIQLQQTPLIPAGHLQLPAPCETFELSAFSPFSPWCVMSAGAHLSQLDGPGPPPLLRRFDDLDVRGVIPLAHTRVLFWGNRGIVVRDGTDRGIAQTVTSAQILAAAHFDG